MRANGWSVIEEPHITCEGSFVKPDIVCWKQDEASVVLDAQVLSDYPGVPLDNRHEAKAKKYDKPVIREWMAQTTGRRAEEIEFSSITF